MKRLLAILLTLVMLVPMCLVAQAEETEIKPFCLSTWSQFENEYTNVYYMPFFWSDSSKIKKEGKARVTCPGLDGYDGSTLAEKLKSYFDTVPEGARYLNFCLVHDAVVETIEDTCIMDNAIPIVNEWLENFLAEYKSIGGKLDGLFTVVEYMRIYGSYIYSEVAKDDPLIYDRIVKNPVYQEKIRPKLVERGFKFYEPVTEQTPEIFSIHPNSGAEYATSRAIWDTVMRSYLGQTVTDCCAPLLRKYYPDAIVSDYQSKDIKPWVKEISDTGGVMGGGGIQTTAGTASNDNFSFSRPKNTFYKNTDGSPAYKNITGYNKAIYDETEFNAFLFDANVVKSTYLSSDSKNITYWATPVYYGKNVYYSETLIHMGMVNPRAYHGYIIKGDCGNDQEKYEAALKVVDDTLRDLTHRVGAADRKPIAVEASWNHAFVLSGMNAGGKNVWRITPDISKTTKEAFKVKDSDPTFYLDGETVTFPGGRIVADGEVSMVGTCGYWVETAEDVYPVITRDTEYFRNYPAFGEDYEAYALDTEYTYNNVKPQATWEPKKNGTGSAVVVADPADADNQVLAVKGSYTLKNVKILKNITAGDTFSERQGWEVSFTLPSDMAADAELVLLNASGNKKASKDGGFKIAGGKVYYCNNGEYAELEGVSLTAGTKYTVIRDMDFTDKDAITCDYYVYSGDTLQGKVTDIPVAAMTVPVDYITMTCKNIAGQAVLLDDYRLYATAVTNDFYLYDATTGMPVTDTDKAREGDTAYRLSWLNGTDKEKNYSVVAAYYNGDTLASETVIEQIKMAPNADGVTMGVVKNETAGQTMRLYLRDDNPADGDVPADPGENDTPTDPEKPGIDTTTVIIIAAAAAAVVIAVVVIVIISKKKKTDKETTQE